MDQLANPRDSTTHTSSPSADSNNTISDLTDLPPDVFLLIISYLSPAEDVLCRRVSRAWNTAFTCDDVSRNLTWQHFPHAREVRNAVGSPDRSVWARIFPKVARRYYYLRSARPSLVEKIDTIPKASQSCFFQEVEPWIRWLHVPALLIPVLLTFQFPLSFPKSVFQYSDPNWCLEDGLLIYHERVPRGWVAYDLETRHRFLLPFDGSDKIVRRLRLVHGTLVIEWCEREPCHRLDGEHIHWHFATAFDVWRSIGPTSSHTPSPWEIRFRCEWRIRPLGLSVTSHNYFFSAHTATHYALYVWEQNGPSNANADPVEQLTVWTIKDTSLRHASKGHVGVNAPDITQAEPRVITELSARELGFLGIRQGRKPILREIFLDEANIYVHEEVHPWLTGEHAPNALPRGHHVRSTGIPFSGDGPRWFDECCANGGIHLNFCPRTGSVAHSSSGAAHSDMPRRFDRKWAGWAPCWRHEEYPYLTIADAVDEEAKVRIVARQCFAIEALSSSVLPKLSVRFESNGIHEVRFTDDMWKQLLGTGKIMGDERWLVGEDCDSNLTVVRF